MENVNTLIRNFFPKLGCNSQEVIFVCTSQCSSLAAKLQLLRFQCVLKNPV